MPPVNLKQNIKQNDILKIASFLLFGIVKSWWKEVTNAKFTILNFQMWHSHSNFSTNLYFTCMRFCECWKINFFSVKWWVFFITIYPWKYSNNKSIKNLVRCKIKISDLKEKCSLQYYFHVGNTGLQPFRHQAT